MCTRQDGILTVILASRMTGNPQISGEISGQNHAPFMSRMGCAQNHALFMSQMGSGQNHEVGSNLVSKETISFQRK